MEHRNQLSTLDREIEDAKATQRELWDSKFGVVTRLEALREDSIADNDLPPALYSDCSRARPRC
jgi:hypothetical protein